LKNKVLISIIIPCYNSEHTLEDTLISVKDQNFEDWEAIIVNDGSPDNLEAIAIQWVQKDNRFKYYTKLNGGLGAARNFGISKANGKYILPLDSDNKVRPDYCKKAIEILEKDSSIGVVYGDAMYFGEKEGLWKVGEFSKYKMMQYNYIDACAIIRKTVFDSIGGYDTNLPYQGHEDWDLWLSIIQSAFKFYYLESVSFDYRVSSTSMIKTFNHDMMSENINYIKKKHIMLRVKLFLFYRNNNGDFMWRQKLKKIAKRL
jgi:glycosyltransferase involved in cell wall biosynthesis